MSVKFNAIIFLFLGWELGVPYSLIFFELLILTHFIVNTTESSDRSRNNDVLPHTAAITMGQHRLLSKEGNDYYYSECHYKDELVLYSHHS